MKRIKLIFAVGVVMVAMLALNAGSAMADEIEDFEIDGNDFGIELEDGDLELDDLEIGDLLGFHLLALDDELDLDLDDELDLDLDDDDDNDDDDNDVSINEGNDQGVVRVVDSR
jgi:hypothetical protein